MSQHYQRELDFALSLLQKLRIPAQFLHPGAPLLTLDHGIRQALGLETGYDEAHPILSRWSEPETIYKITDPFFCHYVYFHLPPEAGPASVVIGPYLTNNLRQESIWALAESMHLPMQFLPQLENYFMSLPVYPDTGTLMAILSALGQHLWGGNDFHVVDVNYEQRIRIPNPDAANPLIEQENMLRQMKLLEDRYAYENELMEIVSKGQTNRADMIMEAVSLLNFEPRHADPLRNMKNYCIVCNTLLRKAAQQGGVHPFHLDQISDRFARTIENMPTREKCAALIGEMIRDYCHLVRNNTATPYTPLIQKTLLYMEANISGDLSLTTLARLMEVTPSYLSARFHRETGHTLAEHITDVRMKTALQLLKNTHLQVQSVAQLCGIPDPNYFGKQFKRFYGLTPLQYRKSQGPFSRDYPQSPSVR